MRGLYVEDDISLAQAIRESLKDKGVDVEWARTVKDSLSAIQREDFKFFILDIGLLDGEGYEVARHIKEKNITAPILFLTARNSAEDRLKGYELGAVEYIPKPFLFAELWMRLDHVLKDHVEEDILDLGDLKVHLSSYSFKWSDGKTVFLSEKEFRVFLMLYKNSPAVVRRSDILDQVWGKDNFPTERTVDNIILKLRQYLKSYGSCIKSVRGVGYSWNKGD